MQQKVKLRKKYLNLRKEKYYSIDKNFFFPLLKLFRKEFKKKPIKIALYYPSNFELNVLKVLELKYFSSKVILLPAIEKNNLMKFYPWKKNEVLAVNKFGMIEPVQTKAKVPDVMLIPLLAFDKDKFRLGYGKGYYDRYLNKYIKIYKDILTVGVAFSFQKHHKLPLSQHDIKIDFILTEKGIFS
jgi:5-formyltetrahydrofolate cyclo-ligase|tara:strand:+ start:261 stop:815 length:555 start_codon:yes stop_codon:yes gene_type:complete